MNQTKSTPLAAIDVNFMDKKEKLFTLSM